MVVFHLHQLWRRGRKRPPSLLDPRDQRQSGELRRVLHRRARSLEGLFGSDGGLYRRCLHHPPVGAETDAGCGHEGPPIHPVVAALLCGLLVLRDPLLAALHDLHVRRFRFEAIALLRHLRGHRGELYDLLNRDLVQLRMGDHDGHAPVSTEFFGLGHLCGLPPCHVRAQCADDVGPVYDVARLRWRCRRLLVDLKGVHLLLVRLSGQAFLRDGDGHKTTSLLQVPRDRRVALGLDRASRCVAGVPSISLGPLQVGHRRRDLRALLGAVLAHPALPRPVVAPRRWEHISIQGPRGSDGGVGWPRRLRKLARVNVPGSRCDALDCSLSRSEGIA
mmetsp:Transcript_113748/g.328468  ORF Transcript_113748/g.328468 Transcript_113748/m.328468 type:complete len:333 (+) Transcript_113748:523-1521(+)